MLGKAWDGGGRKRAVVVVVRKDVRVVARRYERQAVVVLGGGRCGFSVTDDRASTYVFLVFVDTATNKNTGSMIMGRLTWVVLL